ncbi:MAG: hypothetical protein J6Z45_04575 [Oscillospiraceae bacterium]|nr:hypothetical protein [Oscillospiraceae bacterium]
MAGKLESFLFGEPRDPDAARFELLREETVGGRTLLILRDALTGVLYVTGTGDSCPLTPMIYASGSPVTELRRKTD